MFYQLNCARKVAFYKESDPVSQDSVGNKYVEAIFMSVLDYGDTIYGTASPSDLEPLNSVYHSALRFISGELPHTPLYFIVFNKVE